MTVIPSVESYQRDADERDLYFGLAHPDGDELHDRELARLDRLADHVPPQALAWMTPPALPTGPSPNPVVASPPAGDRDGEGLTPNPA